MWTQLNLFHTQVYDSYRSERRLNCLISEGSLSLQYSADVQLQFLKAYATNTNPQRYWPDLWSMDLWIYVELCKLLLTAAERLELLKTKRYSGIIRNGRIANLNMVYSFNSLGCSHVKLWSVKWPFFAVRQYIGFRRSSSLTMMPGLMSKFCLIISTSSSELRSEVP